MRQLYEKSGSQARFSDFAIDIRKIVRADHLPEYTLEVERNEERAEVVYITPRSALAPEDPRAEPPRHPRRRMMRGIYAKPLKLGD
jgi:plasmid replication initiation protein